MGDFNWLELSAGALAVETETDLECIREYLNLGELKNTILFTFYATIYKFNHILAIALDLKNQT